MRPNSESHSFHRLYLRSLLIRIDHLVQTWKRKVLLSDFQHQCNYVQVLTHKKYWWRHCAVNGRSRYSRADQHAPAHPPHIIVTPMPRRSMFRDAASIAGGVTLGTTMGHLAGEAITGMFSGRRREEVVQSLPQNYQLGTEPSGPCAFEIAQFLQCATSHDNLQECEAFNQALRECKRRNRLP